MIRPKHDRILVKKINLEKKTQGGIILGEIESEREVCFGKVVACGPGKQVDSVGIIPLTTKPGDIIAFNDMVAKRINLVEELFLIRESDIYCDISDEQLVIKDYVSEKMEERQPRILR